jgi:hypothetical protein
MRFLCILLALFPLACNGVFEDEPKTRTLILPPPYPAKAAKASCAKWEYNTVVADSVTKLDLAGYRGWEAVSFQILTSEPIQLLVLMKKRLECSSCRPRETPPPATPPKPSSGPEALQPPGTQVLIRL